MGILCINHWEQRRSKMERMIKYRISLKIMMNAIPIKTKNRVIVKFINGRKLEDISLEERISLSSVEEVIAEWKQGYVSIDLGNEIAQEMKDLALMLRDKEITVQDLIEGYYYYNIFKGKERDGVIEIVNEIYSMDSEKRQQFIRTVEKMMNLSRYRNIEYAEIPKAIEDMVERGRELNRELKSKEIQNLEVAERLTRLKKEIEELEEEKKNFSKEIAFSKYLALELPRGVEDENALKNVIESIKYTGFDAKKIQEVADEIVLIKRRDMGIDQFLKVSKYFEELMQLGLTVPMVEKLLDNVKGYGMDIDEYLNERSQYVRDKIAYTKSLKELIETHKKAEKQIRALNEEIALKKLKLARQ
jgi:hypothetical protein